MSRSEKKGAAPISQAELETCLSVLRSIAGDRSLLAGLDGETRRELLTIAGQVARPDKGELRNLAKALRRRDRREKKQRDEEQLEKIAGIRALRRDPVFQPPPRPPELPPVTASSPSDGELQDARACYICKADFNEVHFFYDSMCPACGDFNYAKRNQAARLDGRVALITGARVKIGYHAGLKLLRAGARVIVTTRFPRDAAQRYAREPDYSDWSSRLTIHGLDLVHTPSVELFTQHLLRSLDRLDFIVNNACQTVRRPPGFYAHMLDAERAPLAALPKEVRPVLEDYESLRGPGLVRALDPSGAAVGLRAPETLSQISVPGERTLDASIFPAGRLDADLQQVDLREMNSWRLRLGEVPTLEILEVHLVNAVAPFVLNGKLRALMARDRTGDKHIVNVSAMEGQFYRTFKTDRHPHTNMAKAALNMMTRTSAPDYAKDGIHMNSVDTGWVTDEDPMKIAERKAEEQGAAFRPPLDVVDGAARILDPIFDGLLTGSHRFGLFFKDYQPVHW